jgi:hypothetical protein
MKAWQFLAIITVVLVAFAVFFELTERESYSQEYHHRHLDRGIIIIVPSPPPPDHHAPFGYVYDYRDHRRVWVPSHLGWKWTSSGWQQVFIPGYWLWVDSPN